MVKLMACFAAVVAVAGVAAGYVWFGKQGGRKTAAKEIAAPAPKPAKPALIAISGQFKKDLARQPSFVLGDRPIPFEADEEERTSFLAGGTVEVVSTAGDVVATGMIAANGTFTLEIPPAPKYIVRARNDVVSVSYAVVAGGLPDMKAAASKPDIGAAAGHAEAAHGGVAEH